MKAYYVAYKIYGSAELEKGISFLANNKYEAWDKATYELIPEKEGEVPYSSWVVSVTYNNGRYHRFNTSEGKPY